VKYWEIIADNLSKAGWSWGCVSAIDFNGRMTWIADAHQGEEKQCLRKERERDCHPTARAPMKKGLSSPRRQPRFLNRNASDKWLYKNSRRLWRQDERRREPSDQLKKRARA
jgi:hypothetical protein